MPTPKMQYVKIFHSLFEEDDRFLYHLTDTEQLLFIKLLWLAGLTKNNIPKNLEFIKSKVFFRNSLESLELAIKNLKNTYNCLQESEKFYFFKDFEKLHNYQFDKYLGKKTDYNRIESNLIEDNRIEDPSCLGSEIKEKTIPLNNVFNYWNQTLPALAAKFLSEKRSRKLRARLKEQPFIDEWKHAINKIKESDFLSGRYTPTDGRKKWAASFDWFIDNSNNYIKIIEGKYDNQKNTEQKRVRLVL